MDMKSPQAAPVDVPAAAVVHAHLAVTRGIMDLIGKSVLITGGSSGIGLALAKRFARNGADVWILARRLDVLQKAQKEIEQARLSTDQVIGILQADVGHEASINQVLTEFCEATGAPDYLVCAAGIVQPGLLVEQPLEIFQATMQIDYFGSVASTKAVLPYMISRKSGHIAFISSLVGFAGSYGYASYAGPKFALRGFADVLRTETLEHHLTVSIVYPPDTDTPQHEYEKPFQLEVTKEINKSAGLLSADKVAEAIYKGLLRKQYIITPNFETWFAYLISSTFLVGVIDSLTRNAIRKVNK
ncbi:MAG TPA: SDR family oxidoreductase [Longilinea sp.]|nr:SDR family oxidoreductase [Longilinea sp.]